MKEVLLQNGRWCPEQDVTEITKQTCLIPAFFWQMPIVLLCYYAPVSLQRGIYRAFACYSFLFILQRWSYTVLAFTFVPLSSSPNTPLSFLLSINTVINGFQVFVETFHWSKFCLGNTPGSSLLFKNAVKITRHHHTHCLQILLYTGGFEASTVRSQTQVFIWDSNAAYISK